MRKRRWSAAEVGMLWPRYPEEGPAPLARELGRSEDSVASQAARLGLWSQQQHRRRANTRAERNRSVNVHFFHTPGPVVAAVLGYLWARGGVRTTPRHVLSLRCPRPGEPVLLAVRSALGSRHHVRRRRGHTVVEVCSRPLVQGLLQNFGPPPGRSNPDPPLPPIPAGLLPDFARGLLAGGGHTDQSHITWGGTRQAMTELQQLIRAATGVGAPLVGREGKRHTITWVDTNEVTALRRWLRLQG